MALTLIKVPASVRRGEVFQVHATIGHPMETGYRPGADGKTLPRNIITRFRCDYNNELVFGAEMFPATAANPYMSFYLVGSESGTLKFTWEGDQGFVHTQDVALQVT
jgi:sulfur-oxidizing protein SoxZ